MSHSYHHDVFHPSRKSRRVSLGPQSTLNIRLKYAPQTNRSTLCYTKRIWETFQALGLQLVIMDIKPDEESNG